MAAPALVERTRSTTPRPASVNVVRPHDEMAALWADALDVRSVGWDDDFASLGGKREAAEQIVARLWQRFGIELEPAALMDAKTVRNLCEFLDRRSKPRTAAPSPLQIPFAKLVGRDQPFREATHPFGMTSDVVKAMDELAGRLRVTRSDVGLAVFQAILHRHCQAEELTIASIVAGNQLASFETSLIGEPSFSELVRRGVEARQGALDRGDTWSSPGTSPIVYHFGNRIQSTFGSHDLGLILTESDGNLEGRISYNAERFEPFFTERLAGHFVTLLAGASEDPNQPISRLPMLTESESRQIVYEWNDTAGDFPREAVIQEAFEERVKQFPDAVAVVAAGRVFTYRQIDQRANQLAHYLKGLGIGPGTFTGISLKRSEETIVAVLAVLKAGGAYAPLDPAYPKDRLAFMLRDTKAPVVLTQSALLDRLPEGESRYLCIDQLSEELAKQPTDNPERSNGPDDRAYVIYTSGSTGQPKGVLLRHRPVVNVLDWVNQSFKVGTTDRLLFVTSLSFDLSVYDIFGVLGAGGSIRVADEEDLRDPCRLLRILKTEPITIWDSAPAALQQLVPFFSSPKRSEGDFQNQNPLASRDHPGLRLVMLSGDWIPVALPDQMRATFSNSNIISLGGATEAAIWSNWYPIGDVDPRWPSIPYGKPIRNARYHVLDKHLQPVPVGVAGELHIGGDVLADGYLNRDELTAERFIADSFSAALISAACGLAARVKPQAARLYKTGDLARYFTDGNIEFLGRLDTQVKVRGFRVEAGEIEAILSQQSGVQEAVVKPHKDSSGQNYLVVYIVAKPKSQLASAELTRQLQAKLPDYMVPAHIVFLDAMPITPNGKLDRSALLPPDLTAKKTGEYAAPADAMETAIARIWADVLGIARVGRNDNFFEIGGHSLRGAQVVARLQEQFRVELALPTIFRKPTVAGLAETIRNADRGNTVPLTRITTSNRAPASLIQQRFWFLDRALPDKTIYNVADSIRIHGPLDPSALQWAWNALVARQDSFRTTFDAEDGRPIQVVHDAMPVTLPCIDLTNLPAGRRESEAKRLIAEGARQPFDMAAGPLWRVRVIKLTDDEHLLNWTIHHIIIDESSRSVLLRDLWDAYGTVLRGKRTPLPELPASYIDFTLWQRERLTPESIDYWKERLLGTPPPLTPPHPKPRPAMRTYAGANAYFDIPPRLAEALAVVSRQAGVTPFITFLAAFQALLSRYTGQRDVCVGCPVTSRPGGRSADIVGCFINTLVLRTNLGENPTFRELLGRARDTLAGAFRYVDVPFEKLIEVLKPERVPGGHPLFQTTFIYQGEDLRGTAPGGLSWKHDHMERVGAKFDVSLIIENVPGEVKGCFEYSTELYDEETIARYVGHFLNLLEGIAANPETRLADLPIVPPAEREHILRDFNRTAADLPRQTCVHQLVEAQAARTPNAVAFEFDGTPLSFRELNERANRLAHHLRTLGVGPDTLVGICVQRSLDVPVAMLGILKAGGAYVPLDPDFPAERLAYYASDSKMPIVVAHQKLADRLPREGVKAVFIDTDAEAIALQLATNPENLSKPESLVYILYTSGSTGKPNGVAIPHQALANLLISVKKEPGLSARDTILSLTTLSFDIHTVETWLPMICGAKSVIVPREVALDGHRLAELLDRCNATVMQSTPATWRLLLTAGWKGKKNLRAFSGGEPLTHELIQQITSRTAILWNMYGPTETTVYSVIHKVSPDDRLILIGKPIANTQCYILDPQSRQPMPLGCVGEIYIGGEGLARGYLGRDELTEKRFVVDPFVGAKPQAAAACGLAARMYKTGDLGRYLADGGIECLGRVDYQVKIRGFRIELNEIERVLEDHPDVAQGIVIAKNSSFAAALHAYYRCESEKPTTPADLRKFLQGRLPDYMIPATFTKLDAFPQTPNGKVDRKALPEPTAEDSARASDQVQIPPANDAERALVALWEEVLGVKPIGVTDDFLELGGHSLMAAVLMSRIETRLGHRIPIEALFNRPTVRGIAEIIQKKLELGSGVIVPLQTAGTQPPLFLIAGAGGHVFAFHKFARVLGTDFPAYGMKAVGVNGTEPPLDSIPEIAKRYVKEIVAECPDGPYVIGGYSVGGRIALEVGLQLQALGKKVPRLIVFDMYAPGSPIPLPMPRRLLFHAKKFMEMPFGEKFGYLKERIRRVRSRLFHRLDLHEYDDPGFDGLDIVPRQIIGKVWTALIQANECYRPTAKYDGKVVLLSSDQVPEWSEAVQPDPQKGWSKWSTAPVDVLYVAGKHMELFKDEYQEKLAAIVRSIIVDAGAKVAPNELVGVT